MAWEKWQSAVYIDAADAGAPDWARIGRSEVYDLALNALVERMNFVEDQGPANLVKGYRPEIAQELYTLEGDRAFDCIFSMLHLLPKGEDAVRRALFVFPQARAGGAFAAWLAEVSVVLTNFRPVDKKLLFRLEFCGDITSGTATFTGGVPAFRAI